MRETAYQASVDPAGNATFGPGLVFEGKLSFKGQVEFNGTFKGAITTDDLLIIGEQAKVDADIRCGSVVVNGEVTGKIRARDSVELRGHARVKADLVTPSFLMDRGVIFEGYCNMDPAAAAVRVSDGRHQKVWPGRGRKDPRGSDDAERPQSDSSAD
jgi:cytoskeletal protein CcmA (bactofilin family)